MKISLNFAKVVSEWWKCICRVERETLSTTEEKTFVKLLFGFRFSVITFLMRLTIATVNVVKFNLDYLNNWISSLCMCTLSISQWTLPIKHYCLPVFTLLLSFLYPLSLSSLLSFSFAFLNVTKNLVMTHRIMPNSDNKASFFNTAWCKVSKTNPFRAIVIIEKVLLKSLWKNIRGHVNNTFDVCQKISQGANPWARKHADAGRGVSLSKSSKTWIS